MKLTIEYDPVNGRRVADGKVGEFVDEIIDSNGGLFSGKSVGVSNFLVIEEVRARIVEGTIPHKDVTFKFEGKVISHDKDAKFSNWPRGFGDKLDDLICRILKF